MSRERFVYFVRQTDGQGPVKIGCSEYPETRLSTLQTWAPYPLATVATLPGDETLERSFHALFADQHSHREWFKPSPLLDAVISEIQAGTFDLSSLPSPRCLTNSRLTVPLSDDVKLGMSFKHRIRHLENRGVEIPAEVTKAAFRWSAGRYYAHYSPHDPVDRATIEAFLVHHPRLTRKRAA